jgi:hypothetical protein
MSKTTTPTLDEAVEAVRKLPEETQSAIAHELMHWVDHLTTPTRDPERQAIIAERMRKPLETVSRDAFMTMLRKYNPAL